MIIDAGRLGEDGRRLSGVEPLTLGYGDNFLPASETFIVDMYRLHKDLSDVYDQIRDMPEADYQLDTNEKLLRPVFKKYGFSIPEGSMELPDIFGRAIVEEMRERQKKRYQTDTAKTEPVSVWGPSTETSAEPKD